MESNIWHKRTYLQNRNKLTDIKNTVEKNNIGEITIKKLKKRTDLWLPRGRVEGIGKD